MKPVSQVVALVSVVAYLALVVPQLNRPLMYDDANFALAARAIADTGLPFGNQGWMSDRGDFSQREQWALWHPPLYIYADGLLARIGGWTPPVLRLLGVVGALCTALLTWLLAQDLTRGPPASKAIAGASAVALVLLCPLVIQSTLVLDIDFALLLPLTLLFIWLYVRLEATRRRWLWLALLFAVLLWAKMTNPLPLPIVLATWQVLRGRPLRAVLHGSTIGVGGAALFGASWLAIGRWLGFPLDMPFGVNLVQWQDSADVARRAYTSPGAFIEGLQPTVIWLGPGLVSLGLIAVALRVAQLARCWQVKRAELLIGVAAVLVLGYVNKSAGWFPKYQVALAPLLACLAAPLLAQAWCAGPRVLSGLVPRAQRSSIRDSSSEESQPTPEAFRPTREAFRPTVEASTPTRGAARRMTAIAALSAAAAAAITLILIRDQWALDRSWSVEPVAGAWLLAVLVIGAASGLKLRLIGPSGAAALLGIALGWSLGVDGVQYRASYQTDYWYGTTGTAAASDWVDAHLAPDQTYVSAKEVAIRSRDQRYVDQDNFVYLLSIGRPFDGTWAGEPLRAVVSWQREPYVADLFNRVLPAAGFVEAERFGDYVVYVPTS